MAFTIRFIVKDCSDGGAEDILVGSDETSEDEAPSIYHWPVPELEELLNVIGNLQI